MANELDIGAGGPASPQEVPTNPGPEVQEAQPSAGLGGSPPQPDGSAMTSHYHGGQEEAAARYQKMMEAKRKLDATRTQMDWLLGLGDTVTTEDLVVAAGKLVAQGLGAVAMAGLLADAPEAGEALQTWVQQQEVQIQQREAQAQQALDTTRHEMGVAALKTLIAASHEGGQIQQPMAPTPDSTPQPASSEASNAA